MSVKWSLRYLCQTPIFFKKKTNSLDSKRSFLQIFLVDELLASRLCVCVCFLCTQPRFFWLCRFPPPQLQFHMQSMHQPYPCYLLKQSFWNPIWGWCRLNKISFWFGLPQRMGLLCFSRQNKQAGKVCPVLHGWWCDLRITIRPFTLAGLAISSTSCVLSFCFPFHLLSFCVACRLPAGQSCSRP